MSKSRLGTAGYLRACLKVLRCMFLLMVAAPYSRQALATEPSVESVLEAIKSYRADVEVVATGRMSAESSQAKENSKGRIDVVIRSFGTRKLLSVVKAPPDPTSQGLQTDFELHANGDVFFSQAAVASNSNVQVPSTARDALLLHSREIAGLQVLHRENLAAKLGEAGVLIWWIGRTPLELYLEEPARVQLMDGRLLASSAYGELELVATEESGWLPIFIRLRKTEANKCLVGSVKKWYQPIEELDDAPKEEEEEIVPKGSEPDPELPLVREITWECKISAFRKVNDRVYPGKFLTVANFRKQDASSSKLITEFDIDKIDLAPTLSEIDLRTNLNFREGTKVTIEGATHLPYRWDGSKPVPGVASVIQDSPITPSPSNAIARVALIIVISGMSLVLALLIRFRRQVKDS